MPSIEKEPIYDVYCTSRHQYQRFLNIGLIGDDSVAQLVALMSGVLLGGVAEVVGSNLVSLYFFFFFFFFLCVCVCVGGGGDAKI